MKSIYKYCFICILCLMAVVSTMISLLYQVPFEGKSNFTLFISKGTQLQVFMYLTICTGLFLYLYFYRNNFFDNSLTLNILYILLYFIMGLFLQIGIYTNTSILFFFLFNVVFIYFCIISIIGLKNEKINKYVIQDEIKCNLRFVIIITIVIYIGFLIWDIVDIVINNSFLNRSLEVSLTHNNFYGVQEPNVYKRLLFLSVINLLVTITLFINLFLDIKIFNFKNILESNIVSFIFIIGQLNEALLPVYFGEKILSVPYFIFPIIFALIYILCEVFYIVKSNSLIKN